MTGATAAALFCAALMPTGAPTTAQPTERALVGAIRWDAWHGEASVVGLAVERTLGPKRWHDRLPFYGVELSETAVHARANTQAVMDREIAYARRAGLDYWAFVTYPPSVAMSEGLALYLSSARKRDIRFCLDLQAGWIGSGGTQGWPAQVERYVALMGDPQYQRVLDGRPLVFLYTGESMVGEGRFATWTEARDAMFALRRACAEAGVGSPYIVIQDWSPETARSLMERLGADAVGAYAADGGGRGAPYRALAEHTQRWWDAFRATGAPVVPLATAGWDRRPRVQTALPWEKPGGDMQLYYETPKPAELAAHVRAALRWCDAHSHAAPARAVLIYAWNEIDEGGWLVPTLAEGAARVDALAKVLRASPAR